MAVHGAPRTLYLDCPFGIAGDMLVGALLDLGGAEAEAAVRAAVGALPVGGFSIEVARVEKAGLSCCDFDVVLDAAHDGRDHDMAYLHGGRVGTGGPRGHEGHGRGPHGHGAHEHGAHEHDAHGHEHRSLADIRELLDAAPLAPGARDLARRAFEILARAEARAHGVAVEDVHFHEVGAVDSIVDIVAASVLLDHLGIERAVVPVLRDGHGTIRCQHGVIPVPVPATVNICAAHGLPLAPAGVEGELVTPTGAALVAALDPSFELPARYTVARCGLGAGKRCYEVPSFVRALLIREEAPASACDGSAVKLECDIDDATGEQLAYAAERLRTAGAWEVHWLPVFTKKGRPAYQLQVICAVDAASDLELVVLRETTTIGVRRQVVERTVLPRRAERVETAWGPVAVKRVELPDGSQRATPEYEDVATVARREGLPYGVVDQAVRAYIEAGGPAVQ